MRERRERLQWFKNRIGKVLYRNEVSCPCAVCKNVTENGLLVTDDFHASYLYDCETEFTAEGHPTRYFDTKEELNEWLKTLSK